MRDRSGWTGVCDARSLPQCSLGHQFLISVGQRVDHDLQVLVEVDAKVRGAAVDVLGAVANLDLDIVPGRHVAAERFAHHLE